METKNRKLDIRSTIAAKTATLGPAGRPEERPDRAARYLKRHPVASSHDVARALHLRGSWGPQQAVAALETLVRHGRATKALTPEGVRYAAA